MVIQEERTAYNLYYLWPTPTTQTLSRVWCEKSSTSHWESSMESATAVLEKSSGRFCVPLSLFSTNEVLN